jgi:hypothetical protein
LHTSASFAIAKECQAAGAHAWLNAAIETALEANVQSCATADFRKGAAAFFSKAESGTREVSVRSLLKQSWLIRIPNRRFPPRRASFHLVRSR